MSDYAESGAMLPGLVVMMLQACADRRYDTAIDKARAVAEHAMVIELWAREKSAPPVAFGPEFGKR